jgi:predicted enzyme related to lactoylglutathione lyase
MPKKAKPAPKAQLAGVELYFDDLDRAKRFYRDVLGLAVTGETLGHHAQFDSRNGFICLERKGAENYPSQDKAVLFFKVPDLVAAIAKLGGDRILASETSCANRRQPWAVLHDPEGHNIVLLQSRKPRRTG